MSQIHNFISFLFPVKIILLREQTVTNNSHKDNYSYSSSIVLLAQLLTSKPHNAFTILSEPGIFEIEAQ